MKQQIDWMSTAAYMDLLVQKPCEKGFTCFWHKNRNSPPPYQGTGLFHNTNPKEAGKSSIPAFLGKIKEENMEADLPVINLKPTQYRDVFRVPVYRLSYWLQTMEGGLLTGQLGEVVRTVFESFPEYIQHALTLTPDRGGWADRARFWQTVLRLQLPPRQYHAAMQRIIRWYARCVRLPADTVREADYQRICSMFFCESYRKGAAAEPGLVGALDAELEALGQEIRKPVEELRANQRLCCLVELARRAYEDGAKLRISLLVAGLGKSEPKI